MINSAYSIKTLISILFCFLCLGCKSNTVAQNNAGKNDELVKLKLGNSYRESVNSSGTYALYVETTESIHHNKTFNFIIIRIFDGFLFKEGTFKNGGAEWLNGSQIEITSSSGIENDETKSNKTIIDLNTAEQ